MRNVEIGWLAGLIEGAGCIGVFKNGQHTKQKVATLCINMTDLGVIVQLATVTGVGTVGPKPPKNPNHKPQLYWRVSKQRDLLQILYTVWPLLGERKQQAATEAILCILNAPGQGRRT